MSIAEIVEQMPAGPIEETANTYWYPLPYARTGFFRRFWLKRGIPQDQYYQIGVFDCARSPQSHVGPFAHAIDFLVPDGTPVIAMRRGQLVQVVENFNEWGDDPKFRDKLNYVTIAHDDGEFSQYCHLQQGSVSRRKLKVGDYVETGDFIATVGMTGWTDRPHCHAVVFKIDHGKDGFRSLKIRFEDEREVRYLDEA